MASRIIHLAVCNELIRALPLSDPERFRLGHILPDCVPTEVKKQINSHFIRVEGGRKIFDAQEFYERYEELVLTDDLYLGYYLHLWEDNVFRRVLYYDLGMLAHRGEPELFSQLYLDYNLLNVPIGEAYGVKAQFQVPEDLGPISDIYPFDITQAVEEIADQLSWPIEGSPRIFTRAAAEEFIRKSVDICKKEYEAIHRGTHSLDRWALSIEDKYSDKAR